MPDLRDSADQCGAPHRPEPDRSSFSRGGVAPAPAAAPRPYLSCRAPLHELNHEGHRPAEVGWNALRAAGRRIADRLMSVARSRLETPLNVFMIRCNICGLLKVAQVVEQPPSECPLCAAPIAVLAHYRLTGPMRSNTAVSSRSSLS